jgi:hypothetical protein
MGYNVRMRRSNAPFFLMASLAFLIPSSVIAATGDFPGAIVDPSIQTCAAGWGGLILTIGNLVQFAIALGILITVLMAAYAGFLWVLNPTNPENRSKGRSILINAIIGLVLTLAAWLIVNTVLTALGAGDIASNTSVLGGGSGSPCILPGATAPGGGGSGGLGTAPTTPSAPVGKCTSCVSLATYGVTCKSGCTLDSSVAPKIGQLNKTFNGQWRVTEAYPPAPQVQHKNACHYNGTCIDAAFTGNTTYTTGNIVSFANAAKSSGLRPVFETTDCNLRNQARQAGVDAFCSSDNGYGGITGNHFSVYGN